MHLFSIIVMLFITAFGESLGTCLNGITNSVLFGLDGAHLAACWNATLIFYQIFILAQEFSLKDLMV